MNYRMAYLFAGGSVRAPTDSEFPGVIRRIQIQLGVCREVASGSLCGTPFDARDPG